MGLGFYGSGPRCEGMEWVKLERGKGRRGEAKGEGAARIKGRKKQNRRIKLSQKENSD